MARYFKLKSCKIIFTILCGLLVLTSAAEGAEMTEQNWDKTFAKSEKVDVQKVNFKNRYGITSVRRRQRTVLGAVCPNDGRTRLHHAGL